MLTVDEVTDVFLTTENYLFRRTICDLPTNALNKIFLMLHKDVMRYDGTDDNYVAKLKYALLAKRVQIEADLGASLIWNRGDNIKSCKISYQIDNVSIENETDWLQMAKFHAEWSKKFYDVIVPYLM